ncbi:MULTISPECIES: hypothetical protein [Streptomycetaceae]|uniref:Uncharacterized protein n=1 Tax=Streptantibioticus cattleyicolor (strain ATCC 35852 / DSM 46488 / JCM 4925 / NBRC 14057 / NRRL 8057) TaxID=1003195 RepID=G8WMY4_STREN|nr:MULTISPECIES: hypothetical protein [Streptomycetaceae]AEW92703.1 hypothetical protein SCATT_03320 [Streptantibioticus cattleyicolor NRRL 8057 = DSM 46488]MYS57471.1 hypothetical protein [Streptomyces sp. SID5468]
MNTAPHQQCPVPGEHTARTADEAAPGAARTPRLPRQRTDVRRRLMALRRW